MMSMQCETHQNRPIEGTVDVIPVEIAVVASAMTLSVLFVPLENMSARLNETMIIGLIGFLLFLAAKISLVKNGRFSTWGPTPMRGPFRMMYFVGYGLMALSTLALVEKIL